VNAPVDSVPSEVASTGLITIVKHPVKSGKRLASYPVRKVMHPLQVAAFSRRHPELGSVIKDVRAKRLTYLAPKNLVDLSTAVLDAEARGLMGAVVEAGTALGGSAIVLARSKNPTRRMCVFDAFGMIPPPTDRDGEDIHRRYATIVSGKSAGIGRSGDLYYGYRNDLLGEVTQSFSDFGVVPDAENVTFVQGYYEDTMSVDFPIALAHLDCDWYESVMVCLREIAPHVVPGGRFVIDDYGSWSGCTAAVDEFFADRRDYQFIRKSRLHVVKR
jgi:O-methyltransferase